MAGFHIATATGFGSRPTVGRGLATSLGDGPRITTVAGSPTAMHGLGGLVRCMQATTRSGLPLTCRSLAGAAALASAWASADGAVSAGFRSGLAIISIPGG